MIFKKEDIQNLIDKGTIEKLPSKFSIDKINSIILNMSDHDFRLFISYDNTRDMRSKYLVRNGLVTKHNYYSKKADFIFHILVEKYRLEIEKLIKNETNLYSKYKISNLSYDSDNLCVFHHKDYSILIDITDMSIVNICEINDALTFVDPMDIKFIPIKDELKKISKIDTLFDKFHKWKILYRTNKLSKIK